VREPQVFGYALFFMNDKALSYLDSSKGWEVGVGPSIGVCLQSAGRPSSDSLAAA
jgi:hypothetical protein